LASVDPDIPATITATPLHFDTFILYYRPTHFSQYQCLLTVATIFIVDVNKIILVQSSRAEEPSSQSWINC
jgi:hypothetical protein